MDKGTFAMASRNVPVRDELVLNIDGVFPMLKSGEGIPVLKHTKSGKSDPRRLRLDTDDSTLEVLRQSTTASFLNRKMSNRKTYYLKTLEEVRHCCCFFCCLSPGKGRLYSLTTQILRQHCQNIVCVCRASFLRLISW